jgi:hypothetical protein
MARLGLVRPLGYRAPTAEAGTEAGTLVNIHPLEILVPAGSSRLRSFVIGA